jgi:hypothetical protein
MKTLNDAISEWKGVQIKKSFYKVGFMERNMQVFNTYKFNYDSHEKATKFAVTTSLQHKTALVCVAERGDIIELYTAGRLYWKRGL